MKLDLRLLLLAVHAVCGVISGAERSSEDRKTLKVKIGNFTSPVLAGTLTIPCHVTYQTPLEPANSGRRAVLATPRMKWSFISNGKEVEILVARGRKVKISEGYRSRASLPQYSPPGNDLTLVLQELGTNDSGIYRCHVQHGIEDDHDMAEVKVKGVVFLYREGVNRYAYNFFMAQEACARIKAHIATSDQLLAAYRSGYEQCDAGWLADQTVRYPIQTPREGCYGDMDGFPGVRNYGVLDPNDMYDVYCYVQELNGEVFFGSTLAKFTLEEANDYCKTLGAQVATTGQLYAAWSEGLDHCSPGWLSDGSVRYPIVAPREKCGGNSTGVKTIFQFRNQTGFPDSHARYDVYCFRGRHAPGERIRDVITFTDRIEELKISEVKAENEAQGSVDTVQMLKTDIGEEGGVDALDVSTSTHRDPSYHPTMPTVEGTTDHMSPTLDFGGTQPFQDQSVPTQGSTEELLTEKNANEELQPTSSTKNELGSFPVPDNISSTSSHEMDSSTLEGKVNFPTPLPSGDSGELSFVNLEVENEYPDDNISALIEEMGLALSENSSAGAQVPEDIIPTQMLQKAPGDDKQVFSNANEYKTSTFNEGHLPSSPSVITDDPRIGASMFEGHHEYRETDKQVHSSGYTDDSSLKVFPSIPLNVYTTETATGNYPTKETVDVELSGQEDHSLLVEKRRHQGSIKSSEGPLDELVSGDVSGLASAHFPTLSGSSYTVTDSQTAQVNLVSSTPGSFSSILQSHNSVTSTMEEGSGDTSGSVMSTVEAFEDLKYNQGTKITITENPVDPTRPSEMTLTSNIFVYSTNQQANQKPETEHDFHHLSPHVSAVVPATEDSTGYQPHNEGEDAFTKPAMGKPKGPDEVKTTITISRSPTISVPSLYTPVSNVNPGALTSHNLENSSRPNELASTANPLPAVPTERAIHGASVYLSDICFPNPCENGGTCIDEDDEDFNCLCLPGYNGKICDINTQKCLDDWDLFHGFCFKHFHIRRSWEEAETDCRDYGGHLVSLMTPEEQDFVNNKYGEYQWTGLNDRTIEGDFQWSDGNTLLYENWNHQQPDSYFLSGENCVVMVFHDNGHWSDVPCNYHLPYTCKMGLVSCSGPPQVANASIYGRRKTRYQIGSIVGYGCEDGFLQRDSPLIKCQSDGLWENPQISCIPALQ
uniref:Brevican core protein n=1 Tax=Leptobrachium leishanense TaxID=445787 RepID=A0A8C5R1N9_9ANUR